MNDLKNSGFPLSRRHFLRKAALSSAMLSALPILGNQRDGSKTDSRSGPASRTIYLDQDWRFGGNYSEAATQREFDDSQFERVTLPHCVAKLSWHQWQAAQWERVWIYRRHFSLPQKHEGQRVFLHFDGVMTGATPVINNHALPEHLGGYLPFDYEITDQLVPEKNLLAVAVDARWKNAPPEGSQRGVGTLDFFEPGGIHRPVSLRIVPAIFISDVFAKPVNVLESNRRLEVLCRLDASTIPSKPISLNIELFESGRLVDHVSEPIKPETVGETEWKFSLSRLGNVKLWDVDAPRLYEVVVTLLLDQKPIHDYRTRIGFRDARFEADGFFLNGRRLQLFGLNRHELFPYVGFAMPGRVMQHDAALLRHELNCNMVRCSHYPQSEAFFDACDDLGLLVWEEIPGWSYLGDAAWRDLLVSNVKDMVRRDRNHPSIVIWGVRVNESKNDPELYARTTAAAKALDDSRPTSGAMVGGHHSTANWSEDVFAFNDYHHAEKDFSVALLPALPGIPYLVTEAVGQIIGPPKTDHQYRRAGDPALQARQALYHAQAHDQAARDPHCAGVVAWCALDYGSPQNSHQGVKCPGVADIMRFPKLGAAFYQSQIDPKIRRVIQPNFYWDFGAKTPKGPGKNVAIFSNCERLELFLDKKPIATLQPDRVKFPNLKYPPFFCDLEFDNLVSPELRIDGYIGNHLALSRSFSSDPSQDQFYAKVDDDKLNGDGVDCTRLAFKVTDKFGAERLFGSGEVSFEVTGPGIIVGDNPFGLTDSGGVGAVWIKTLPKSSGRIRVVAGHSVLGKKAVELYASAETRESD